MKSERETVPPPSRSRENSGAWAPSTRLVRPAAEGPALRFEEPEALDFEALDFDVLDFEVLVFKVLVFWVPRTVFLAATFNALEADLRDDPLKGLPVWRFVALLPGLLAGEVRGLADEWEDFLRLFLDIRLPFVAFRGSIIALLRQAGINWAARQPECC
jgi:hypothetical protein